VAWCDLTWLTSDGIEYFQASSVHMGEEPKATMSDWNVDKWFRIIREFEN
jgi:hypothetical protein